MSIPGRGMHLQDYLRVLNKRRRVVALFFAVCFSLVVVVTFTQMPLYEGRTKVLLERGDSGALTERSRSTSYDPEFYSTQFQLIKSRAVARRVIDTLMLKDRYYSYFPELKGEGSVLSTLKALPARLFNYLFKTGNVENTQDVENEWENALADAISRDIKVTPVGESRLVIISYLSSNPQFAALVTNTVAKAFIEETLNMKMEATRRTLEWMTKKAQAEGEQLEKAENALQAYMQANGIVTLENRITVTPEKLSELSTYLVRAESRRKELESLYRQVQSVTSDPRAAETVAAIASDPAMQALRTQIIEADKKIMELSNKYGAKHPAMEKANADLNLLRDKRSQEIRRIVQSIKNDYQLALANENSLRSQMNSTKSEALQLNEKFIQYSALKREVDAGRQLYDALILKLKEQSINEESQPVNLWIVEHAQIPEEPARPLKGLNLLMGLFLGLFGGVGMAFFLEYLDNKIKDPEEVEAVLGASVLGIVPMCRANQGEIEGIALREPLSSFAENYNILRSSLLLSAADAPPRKIVITSPGVGEGKTSTALNLALALAQSEKTVVLIDGDLRKPRIHKTFKMANDIGLSTYLAGASAGGILKKGPLSNLSVITSGPVPPNPADLISSARMASLIEFLTEKFDYIICDAPPTLVVADARVISRHFDGTILVVKAHHTTFEMAARATKSLLDVNIKVLGLVINGLDPKKSDHYYGEYYSTYTKSVKTATASALAKN